MNPKETNEVYPTIAVFFAKAQALASIKSKESYLDVREVIEA